MLFPHARIAPGAARVARRGALALLAALLPSALIGVAAAKPPPAASPPAATDYRGHGLDSVPASALARYAPRPLSEDDNRRLQQYLDIQMPGSGVLTPDGRQLVFTWQVTGVSQVWRLDGPRQFPVQLTAGDDRTEVLAVLPGGKQLVLARDRKGEENPGIYLQALSGGPLQVVQHIPGVQSRFHTYSRDGRYLYFTANDRRPDAYAVYRHDLRANRKELLFEEPGLWQVSDVRDDGRLLLSRHTGSVWKEIYELAPGEADPARRLRPLFGQGEREEYAAVYGARPDEVLVRTNKFSDHHRLYSHRQGKWTPIGEELPYDVAEFTVDRRKTRILYTVSEKGYERPRALDARSFRPLRLPAFARDVDHVNWGGTTDDGRYTALSVTHASKPPQAYVLDWRRSALAAWHQSSVPELDLSRYPVAHLEEYPARDGTRIPAFVNIPAPCEKELCPVIVNFHGGPEGQTMAGFSPSVAAFTDAGFILVRPNVRGSSGYGKRWLSADDGPRRLQVVTDIEDAGRWARERFARQGTAPKVGIYGGSYGGYSAFMGMTRFAGTYDAGVAVVGISDLRTFLRNTAPYRRILRISEYGDPDKDAAALSELSPITHVQKVRAPLLILQGATDPRVPAGEAIQIHETLRSKKIPSDLMIFADEGHGMQKRSNRVLALGHTLAFFRTHLAANGGSAGRPVAAP